MNKAIETVFNGHRYRSRLEARWAVFFGALGVRFEYEREGYDLDGVRYLPDFRLPDYNTWVEIKGSEPTAEEQHKAGLLAAHTGHWVDIFWPEPWVTMNVWGYHSRMAHHIVPRWTDYIDLALSCGDTTVARALMTALPDVYWADSLVQRFNAMCKYTPPPDAAPHKPYRTSPHNRLEICPKCRRLFFGRKEYVDPDSLVPVGIEVDVEADTLTLTTFYTGENCQMVEIAVPEVVLEDSCWCTSCDTECTPNDPALLAAYTAARQARFEFGESGAPALPVPMPPQRRSLPPPSPRHTPLSPALAPPAPLPESPWRAGDHVEHPTFGHGIVVMVKPTWFDAEITVAFLENGVKRLLDSLAQLTKSTSAYPFPTVGDMPR